MSYVLPRRPAPRARRRGLMGLGAFTDNDQCSVIPAGDAYRKPGNYCATPDGGTTTFNADGSTYRYPGVTVDPDPAHPAGTSPAGDGSIWSKIGQVLFGPPATPVYAAPLQTGMSTTTKVALAGGAVLVAVLLTRKK
jgi:hypothetical protein